MKFCHLLRTMIFFALSISFQSTYAQFVSVGAGSYTTQFPGVDAAGRNAFPSGTPYITGEAAGKAVPTNDWWSKEIKEAHADNLFSYPFTMKTVNSGLVVSYIPWGVIDSYTPVTVGVSGLNAAAANIDDFSDWTVTMDWSNSGHHFKATAGIGMPFIYFNKDSADVAQIVITEGTVTIDNEMLIITNAHLDADFAVYAPVGSIWNQNGNTYTSSLNGKNYWSLAFIPLDATNITTVANEYKKYAYVFPVNTLTSWNYNPATSVVRTDFTVETDVKEGTDTTLLLGLLPHQWSRLAADSPVPNQYSYNTVRGELKTLDGNHFSVENTFHGILPTLPYLDFYNSGFSPQQLREKIQLLENDALPLWTDSYNEGQLMNRLVQTARIADLTGDTIARNKIITTVRERLEDWFKAETGEVAFLFYYHQPWTALLGYPAGHGQDDNINDHHFHWGYFIHAAAFIEQYEPGWAAQWGGMVDYLIRDAANPSRDDPMFPFLRNFSPYAGHCWANGFATFPQGNDQESSSESMQFNSSLIHWGTLTGNDSIRDLGIYLYTTEQSAIEEYWFDMYDRIFQATQQYSLVSRVWGNSYDNGTFWTADIAASYGIEMYPIHGGSLYLGQDTTYVEQVWDEISQNTGILNNEVNPNLWHDVMWEYFAFINPDSAISMYNSYPERALKFGISDAQTYHWLYAMSVLGRVKADISADYPIAAAFSNNGEIIYSAYNYESTPKSVSFSDGYVLYVPARSMATSKDISITGNLSSSFYSAYPGGSVNLSLNTSGGSPSQVEFIDGESLIGQNLQAPFTWQAGSLGVGKHNFYARIYDGNNFSISNIVSVIVGEQLPYQGYPAQIPGSIQAAYFDLYQGGNGQGIAYSDVNVENNGGFRETEYVDASMDVNEGGVVGWIASGEWLEYTIDVQQPGNYTLVFRYACGNQSGGGPFKIESDGHLIKSGITVNYSGDWNAWTNKTVNNIPLKGGKQVLRLAFEEGELNLGSMTFTYDAPLPYDQPVADAGSNILVQLPDDVATLDGSNSSDPDGLALTYSWTQIYGPTVLVFSNQQAAQTTASTLEEGVYLLQLTVSNGSYSDIDEVYVISSTGANVAPSVSIYSPTDHSSYLSGESIQISAIASDLIGNVEQVEFYVNSSSIGISTQYPYEQSWAPLVGQYELTAVATDNDGSSTTSEIVHVEVEPAPSCYNTSSNGEFDYEFSPDDNNPTITFIPSIPGMGEPTCILYYGTDAGLLPGYPVTPNVPYQITASEGTLIYFYYTYSYPGQGEHNNSANKDTYVVGSCESLSVPASENLRPIKFYPNPVSNMLTIELPGNEAILTVFDYTGKQIDRFTSQQKKIFYKMGEFKSGLYLFRVEENQEVRFFKIIK